MTWRIGPKPDAPLYDYGGGQGDDQMEPISPEDEIFYTAVIILMVIAVVGVLAWIKAT